MATEKNGEKQGLHQSLRSQMGYGTAALSAATNKTTPKTRKFISRRLLRTDTLMGIALKYGVSVQDLKKENKLWNSDHLFLRETLLIPVTAENGDLLDEDDVFVVFDGSSPSSSNSHLENGDAAEAGDSAPSTSQHSGASAATTGKTRSQSTPSDFFSKYDNNIAKLKGDVAKMEKNAAGLDGIIDANPLSLPPRKGSGPSRRGSSSSTTSSASERRGHYVSDEDASGSPVLVIRSRASSRQIKSAMENLEQVNDDLYEL